MTKDLYGYKVIPASEMSALEKRSLTGDKNKEESFMLQAGAGIAKKIEAYVAKNALEKQVIFLVGKGNNGGDGFVAAKHLKKKGFVVLVVTTYPLKDSSFLNQKMAKTYLSQEGKIIDSETWRANKEISVKATIIDCLLGTGCKGELKEPFLSLIQFVNSLKNPKIAVDIPSGLNGDTGEVAPTAFKADLTLFLGMAKLGFFLNNGYSFTKRLQGIDFGLEKKYVDQAEEKFYLLEEKAILSFLPSITFTRHKYQAGYVLGVASSSKMKGAGYLSSLAALRSGSGMVRLFVEEHLQLHLPIEVVTSDLSITNIEEEMKRAKALFIGPGIGREEKALKLVQEVLKICICPLVIDADALYLLGKNKLSFPEKTILTPHRQEMCYLLSQEKVDEEELIFFSKCQDYVNNTGAIVVLKGAPTILFAKNTPPLIIPRGSPGMATAGSGDVLTGIIASFLSQGVESFKAAALGVYLHGLCGEYAEKEKTPYAMIASDLIEAIGPVLKEVWQSFR